MPNGEHVEIPRFEVLKTPPRCISPEATIPISTLDKLVDSHFSPIEGIRREAETEDKNRNL